MAEHSENVKTGDRIKMGLFDSVYAPCAHCGEQIEYQSKADIAPYLNQYTVDDAPPHILRDVLNEPHYCQKCGKWTVLFDPQFPPSDSDTPRPAPIPQKVRDPGAGEFDSHEQGMRWWEAPFTLADIDRGAPDPETGGR